MEAKEKEKGSLTAITESEPDTPRSAEQLKEAEKGTGEKQKAKTPTPETEPKSPSDKDEKIDKAKISEYFGGPGASEIMKFGNSRIES